MREDTTAPGVAEWCVRQLLLHVGENPDREGLRETPARVVRAFKEMFAGYAQDPSVVLKVFEDGACDEMVLVKNITLWSQCEHHILPFHGVAHVGYLPAGKVVGLSKLARLVDVYAKRLQIQERLTQQITGALMEHLKPKGAACVIEATHLCMCARGVKQPGSVMVTSSLKGEFLTNPEVRAEFLTLIKN